MLLYEFYLEHNGETLRDFRQEKEVMRFIILRKISLIAVWRVDDPEWGWGSRLEVGRSVRWLPQEITIYGSLN